LQPFLGTTNKFTSSTRRKTISPRSMATLHGRLVRNHIRVSPMRRLTRWNIVIVQSFRSPEIRPGPWTSLRIHFVRCGDSALSTFDSPFEPEAGWERSWKLSVGINQATTYGGVTAMSQNGGPPYHDLSGWGSIISPCGDKLIDG